MFIKSSDTQDHAAAVGGSSLCHIDLTRLPTGNVIHNFIKGQLVQKVCDKLGNTYRAFQDASPVLGLLFHL